MLMRVKRAAAVVALLAMLQGGKVAARPADHPLRDIDGVLRGSLEKPSGWKWTLLFFLMSDCPVANQYAPEIERICNSYGPKGAQCFLVYVEPGMKVVDIRTHMKDFKYTCCSAILDSNHELVKAAGATVVSEVALFSNNGELKYRGRIDNLYAGLGKPRQVVSERDLRNALDALIAGRSIPNPRTQAFGCFIP
jgi:hypothetical protein